MRRWFACFCMVLSFLPDTVLGAYINGDFDLRDAIYLYQQPLNAKGSKTLVGVNCDALQLVLDVESGYADLAMGQSSTSAADSIATQTVYPDRITSSAAMFAYALTSEKAYKTFQFRDAGNLASSSTIGSGTVFAYCFSTTPGVQVYLLEQDKCTNKYSNGSTTTITGCTPESANGGTQSADLSSLNGTDSNVSLTTSAYGGSCSGYGITDGSGSASASLSSSGSNVVLKVNGSGQYLSLNLNYQSGNASSGFNLAGTFQEARSGVSGSATTQDLLFMSGNLTGYASLAFTGCTVGVTMK